MSINTEFSCDYLIIKIVIIECYRCIKVWALSKKWSLSNKNLKMIILVYNLTRRTAAQFILADGYNTGWDSNKDF